MRDLPWPEDSLYSLLIRTDYTDDREWDSVRERIETPVTVSLNGHAVGEFRAMVEIIDDRGFDQLTVELLLELARADPNHFVAFLVDRFALSAPDHPILVVDLAGEPRRTFRVIPAELWNVQNNLAIANASWEDYADCTGPEGVFRGFPR